MSNIKNKSNLKISHLELANRNLELEISARKQIERSLKDKEDRFKTIFKYAPVAYFLCNLDGEFLDGNLAALQLTGYTNEELFNKNFIELNLIDKKNLSAVSEIILRCGRGENTGPDEFTITKKDGSKSIVPLEPSNLIITDLVSDDKKRNEYDSYGTLIDGTASITQIADDPEGDMLTYSWEFTDGCGHINSGADTPKVEADMCLLMGNFMPFSVTITVTDEADNVIDKTLNFN